MYKSGQQCACVFLFIDKHMLKLIGCVNFVNALITGSSVGGNAWKPRCDQNPLIGFYDQFE